MLGFSFCFFVLVGDQVTYQQEKTERESAITRSNFFPQKTPPFEVEKHHNIQIFKSQLPTAKSVSRHVGVLKAGLRHPTDTPYQGFATTRSRLGVRRPWSWLLVVLARRTISTRGVASRKFTKL